MSLINSAFLLFCFLILLGVSKLSKEAKFKDAPGKKCEQHFKKVWVCYEPTE